MGEATSATGSRANGTEANTPGSGTFAGTMDLCVIALALALAVAAGVHGTLLPSHARESVLLGLGFGASAVLQLAAAVLVLVRPSRPLFRLIAAGSAVVVAAWAVSRTVGLPTPPTPWTPEPVGLVDALTSVFEIGAIGLSLLLLRPSRGRRDAGWSGSAEAAAVWFAGSVGVFLLAVASTHESPGSDDHVAGHVVHAGILATAVAVLPLTRRLHARFGTSRAR
jgi:hypothetical protein